MRQMIYAILLQAYRDCGQVRLRKDAEDFIKSSWCMEICDALGFNYEKYKKDALSQKMRNDRYIR